MAFTSERGLVGCLGPAQGWVRLSEPALRALAAPLGITELRVDPAMSAAAPGPAGTAAVPHTAHHLFVG